jgi:8-oxo-dGTP pyrophosphatase MutT (NUDIX family)
MDLTIQLEDIVLNIRVAILMETGKGYIFEKHKDGYYFVLGGRVKANESSIEAAQREIFEEIGLKIESASLVAIIENFFNVTDSKIHEICFVYSYEEIIEIELSEEFAQIKGDRLTNEDIRPDIIKKIITNPKKSFVHYITKGKDTVEL